MQPVLTLTVDGGDRIENSVGDSCHLRRHSGGSARAGPIVEVEWDFDGSGEYREKRTQIDGGEGHVSRVCYTVEHAFTEVGTYFPAMRVTSQREGRPDSLYGRMQNVARLRVVVGHRAS